MQSFDGGRRAAGRVGSYATNSFDGPERPLRERPHGATAGGESTGASAHPRHWLAEVSERPTSSSRWYERTYPAADWMAYKVAVTLPTFPERPDGLPKFGNPPLREVAIAVLFQPLAGLTQPHIGRYWELIRELYPRTLDQPPIDPYMEAGAKGRPVFQFQVGPPPLRRSWFISADDDRLVQLQSDRFVHNWRGEGSDYPHLDDLWDSFADRFAEFASWIRNEGIGSVEPFQLELTYVNIIEASSLWDVLTGMEPAMPNAFADDVQGRPVPRLELRYDVQGESLGGLYVHGRPKDDGVQQLDLTYRAVLKSPDFDLIPLAVAAGRRLIVSHFAELTNPDLHKQWERIQ